ncbi:MAG: putative enoyl-CoA hydratase/isomerase family protein [Gemmatimonadales bacterium]|jgi:enoyl-CoA hydratase|nr:putative enoyl-CoA hydratase/isomerase family protein [Gemmatimonadales bacterium]
MVGTSEAAHGDGLVVSTTGGVATVRLDRPARRNALSAPMIEGLSEAMASSDADPAVHAVVLTGTDPAFCAGLDLHELSGSGANIAAAGIGRPWAPTRVP